MEVYEVLFIQESKFLFFLEEFAEKILKVHLSNMEVFYIQVIEKLLTKEPIEKQSCQSKM